MQHSVSAATDTVPSPLLLQMSKLRLFDPETPLYSEARVLPPSKVAAQVIMTGG